MATNGPSEGDIQSAQEICNIQRSQAVILLRKNQTLDAAINAYFNNPTGAVQEEVSQSGWVPADNLPAFQIEAEDPIHIPGLSRPPSRANDGAKYGVNSIGQQFNQAEYSDEQDLERAIAMSQQTMPAQEVGVTPADQHFGPANRSHYDPSQWAMTAMASTREIVDHPPPSKRRRLAGEPAFLRGSRETSYLAPLLNIYHSIPLARQAMLFPSLKVQTYGFDPLWWSGSTDENSKSISVEASYVSNPNRHNFLAEVQCLMATLDNTKRAYASVDALSDMHILNQKVAESPLSRFIEAWIAAGVEQDPSEQLTQIFSSEAIKAVSAPGDDYERKLFQCLEAPIEELPNPTLMDLLDTIIWNDSINIVDDVWMERCAQVFTMRLFTRKKDEGGLGIEIPFEWYPERYVAAYKDAARQMRISILELKKELRKCEFMQQKCRTVTAPDKRVIRIREVLEAAAGLSSGLEQVLTQEALTTGDENATSSSTLDGETIHDQLQIILDSVERKMEVLEQQKRDIRQQMRQISQSLTHPNTDHGPGTELKYVLQGVSTRPNVTYVRRRNHEAPDLIEFEQNAQNDDKWQWWRFEWRDTSAPVHLAVGPQPQSAPTIAQNVSQPFTVERTTLENVLEAARTENDTVLLVYAEHQAIEQQDVAISPALRRFVEQDNRAFNAELSEESGVGSGSENHEVNTTIMDDVSAEEEGSINLAREMTPMSIISPARGLDGQPSPKRPKSSEAHSPDQIIDGDSVLPAYERADAAQAPPHKNNKTGLLADETLQKYNGDAHVQDSGPLHIEHPHTPLR